MLQLPKKISNSFQSTLKRFTLSTILIIISSILLILNTELEIYLFNPFLRICYTLFLGVPLFVFISLILECKKENNKKLKIILNLAGTLFLVSYYFFLLKDFAYINSIKYFGVFIAFCLICLFTPILFAKTEDDNKFELYLIKIIVNFFITIFFCTILLIGMYIIILTIHELFALNIGGNFFVDVLIVLFGIFAPIHFLAGIPKCNQKIGLHEYPKLFKLLMFYIIMPLISVYTVILYLYFIKIIVTLNWPVGWVSNLVLWYSLITTIVIILISPLKTQYKWANIFIKYFTRLLFPLIAMMFAALIIRINAYGITENRYFILILAIWLTGSMLYLNFSKIKRNIILVISLTVVIIISLFSPISAFNISEISQNSQLKHILLKYNMLRKNTIVKSKTTILPEDKERIIDILDYFNNRSILYDVEYLPKNFSYSNSKNVFGFDFDNYPSYEESDNYFTYNPKESFSLLNVTGYNYVVSSKDFLNNEDFNIKFTHNGTNYKIVYFNNTNTLNLYENSKLIYKNKLIYFTKNLIKKYGFKTTYIPQKNLTLTESTKNITVKLIFSYIDGTQNISSKNISLAALDFYILIKIK